MVRGSGSESDGKEEAGNVECVGSIFSSFNDFITKPLQTNSTHKFSFPDNVKYIHPNSMPD